MNYDIVEIDAKGYSLKENNDIFLNRKIMLGYMGEKHSPKVSILVVAYKKLEKTKNCIESVLEYTKNIDYELVLVDCNSQDGTIEYFKSIPYERKKIIAINNNLQLCYGVVQGTRYCSGELIAFLNNDMVVTTNWLDNLLKCIESDVKIGMVCACSSNASNCQDPGLQFSTLEEMQEEAKKFNISDKTKWYEKIRLLTLGVVYRKECIDVCGNWDYGFIHNFADDDLSFHIRRCGYKIMLCGDVFVHHDHEGVIKEDFDTYEENYLVSRRYFIDKYYGIDVWKDTLLEIPMLKMIINPKIENGTINILSIDGRCGATLLETKNFLKQHNNITIVLNGYFEDAKYYVDMKSICDNGIVVCDRLQFLMDSFSPETMDYILIEKEINLYSNPIKVLTDSFKLLKNTGELIVKLRNCANIISVMKELGYSDNISEDNPVQLSIDEINKIIDENGFKIVGIDVEHIDSIEKYMNFVIDFSNKNKLSDAAFDRMTVKNYVLSIVKK